jgi:hypothetical protein
LFDLVSVGMLADAAFAPMAAEIGLRARFGVVVWFWASVALSDGPSAWIHLEEALGGLKGRLRHVWSSFPGLFRTARLTLTQFAGHFLLWKVLILVNRRNGGSYVPRALWKSETVRLVGD